MVTGPWKYIPCNISNIQAWQDFSGYPYLISVSMAKESKCQILQFKQFSRLHFTIFVYKLILLSAKIPLHLCLPIVVSWVHLRTPSAALRSCAAHTFFVVWFFLSIVNKYLTSFSFSARQVLVSFFVDQNILSLSQHRSNILTAPPPPVLQSTPYFLYSIFFRICCGLLTIPTCHFPTSVNQRLHNFFNHFEWTDQRE